MEKIQETISKRNVLNYRKNQNRKKMMSQINRQSSEMSKSVLWPLEGEREVNLGELSGEFNFYCSTQEEKVSRLCDPQNDSKSV